MSKDEALLSWYRSIDQAVRSKGTLYFALHPHGDHAWGRWVGRSFEGLVVSGWGFLARSQVGRGEGGIVRCRW